MKSQIVKNELINPKVKAERMNKLKTLLKKIDGNVFDIKSHLVDVYGALSEIKKENLYMSLGIKSFNKFIEQTQMYEKVGSMSAEVLRSKITTYDHAIESGMPISKIKKIGISKAYSVYISGARNKTFLKLCDSSHHDLEKFKDNKRNKDTGRYIKESFKQRPYTKIKTICIEIPNKIDKKDYEFEMVKFLNKIDGRII